MRNTGKDSFVGDADFGDEGVDISLAFARSAAGDDDREVCPGPFDDGWLRWRGFGAEGAFKFDGAGGELSDLRAQRGEAFAGGFFGRCRGVSWEAFGLAAVGAVAGAGEAVTSDGLVWTAWPREGSPGVVKNKPEDR